VGLYAYAHSRWRLHAPAYASLPVQALGKIAVTEEAESIRSSQEVDDVAALLATTGESPSKTNEAGETTGMEEAKRPLIASVGEIMGAFDTINPLRYSQPTHLAGELSRPRV
jgi:cleavage and polyadenylation specificity factor subunit 2